MTEDKIAKNLLQDKICDNCLYKPSWALCPESGARDNTCEGWVPRVFVGEREYLHNSVGDDDDTKRNR